jgi:hypothetical protein
VRSKDQSRRFREELTPTQQIKESQVTDHQDPLTRQPKGDHNRRLSLGVNVEQFAAEAGITVESLEEYERTGPDHRFDVKVAKRVGEALDRLEAILPNSQTGRQRPAAGVHRNEIGAVARPVLVEATEDPVKHPRYNPGAGA